MVSTTPSQGSCRGTSTVACNLGNLATGASTTVSILVSVDSTTTGTITNTASVAGNETDPVTTNNTSTTTTTVQPAPDQPTTLSIADAAVDEGAGNAVLTISLDPPTTTAVTATYSTLDRKAKALDKGQKKRDGGQGDPKDGGGGGGSIPPKGKGGTLATIMILESCAPTGSSGVSGDYRATTTMATIQANQTSTTIQVPVIEDTLDELDETFRVALSTSSVGTLISSTAATATVVILDNDAPPSVAIEPAVSVPEGGPGATSTARAIVCLSAASGLPVKIDYDISNVDATAGVDYASEASGTLIIPAGNTTGTIRVVINGDDSIEPDETIIVTLSNATTTSTTTPLTITQTTTAVTIVNDDFLPELFAPSGLWVREGAQGTTTTTNVLVSLTHATIVDVSVQYATADVDATAGVDYVAVGGTLTIPAGHPSGVISVEIKGDSLVEGNEQFKVTLSNATTSLGAVTTTQPTTTVTIVDDDGPGADVPLMPGFNLIGIPVQSAGTTTLGEVAQQISSQGGEVSSILAWDEKSQTFKMWMSAATSTNNLVLEEGRGYFVRVARPPAGGAWRAKGPPATSSVPLDFELGYNLVSVPYADRPYDAPGLAQGVRASGGDISSVLSWRAAAQTFVAWVAANPRANPFDILPTAGYFVRATKQPPSPFVPGAPIVTFDPKDSSGVFNLNPFIRAEFDEEVTIVSATFGEVGGTQDDVTGLLFTQDQIRWIYAAQGLAAGKQYVFPVTAKDISGISGGPRSTTFTVLEDLLFEVPLGPGWNLISLPGSPEVPAINSVLTLSNDDVDEVITTAKTQGLADSMSCSPIGTVGPECLRAKRESGGPLTGSLQTVETGIAYWVHTTTFRPIKVDIALLSAGPQQLPPFISVYAPWDLVGVIDVTGSLRSGDSIPADSYFAGVNWSRALQYDTVAGQFVTLLPATGANLEVGRGYYVQFTNDGTLVP